MQKMANNQMATKEGNVHDEQYQALTGKIQTRLEQRVDNYGPLFTTDNEDIWEMYLDSFPPQSRQYHNCSTCKKFIRKYGTLVVVDDDGNIIPALWNWVDALNMGEDNAFGSMIASFRSSKITGVFLSGEEVWGTPVTGIWRHFNIEQPEYMRYKGRAKTAGQALAEKKEDFLNIIRAIREFDPRVVSKALKILRSETLYRSEKVIGPVEWLDTLTKNIQNKTGKQRTNIIWKEVAKAPAGFCHPRSSMAGTLLEDLSNGVDFDLAAKRFNEKMHPLKYQRPQERPRHGNIKQAEALVEKLGIKDSLRRKFARLEDIQTIWEPKKSTPQENETGVFSHLRAKEETTKAIDLPKKKLTWKKFEETVLPGCESIQFKAQFKGNYTALVTEAVPGSHPILQWDNEELRNPCSLYVYHGGSIAHRWGLEPGSYVDVTALARRPNEWQSGYDHFSKGIILVLDGAVDTDNNELALFPETMRRELREIRSTIEAYSKAGKLEGQNEASACGVLISEKNGFDTPIRVKFDDETFGNYIIDRLE